MVIKILIQVNQIHRFPVLDENGVPTGEEYVQFGLSCPEYPDLPTYGIPYKDLIVPYPCTKAQVDAVIEGRVALIKEQMQKDNQLRQQVENMGYIKTTIKGTEFFETEVDV